MCCHFSNPLLLIGKVVLNGWSLSLTDESKVRTREHECWVAHGLGDGQGESGQANEHNGESHGAPLLAPPPPPPLPPMTHAEMMAKLMAARRESAHALELMAQAIAGYAAEATGVMVGTGVVLAVLRDSPLTKICSRPTHPLSPWPMSP